MKLVYVYVIFLGFIYFSIFQFFVVIKGVVYKVEVDFYFWLNYIQLIYKVIKILVSDEIVVYGVNREVVFDDGYLVLFINVLGKEYYIIFYFFVYYYCVFGVIVGYDNIQVFIQFLNYDGIEVIYKYYVYYKNDWINVIMNKF